MKKIILSVLSTLLIVSGVSASTYIVERGDTLSSIGAKFSQSWQDIWHSNSEIANPNLIYAGQELQIPNLLGATVPNIAALFETSLQNSISADATTMTLVSATLANGDTLSGIYGFIIDEGSSNEEFVVCTASGTSLSSCRRGIDPVDGWTEVSALKETHRRGASVKITDFPILGILRNIITGATSTPGGLVFGTNEITGLYQINGTFDWLRYNTSTNALQWSDNGTDYYNFTSSAITQLTASSTRGIGVTDSRIHINASTTQGMQFLSDGYLAPKLNANTLYVDSNGIGVDTAQNYSWSGNNTFSGENTFSATTTATSYLEGFHNIYGDGSDGATTTPYFYEDKIWQFTSLTIPAGSTSTFATSLYDKVIRIRVQGDCVINGGIDLGGWGAAGGVGAADNNQHSGSTSTYAFFNINQLAGITSGQGANGYYSGSGINGYYNIPTSSDLMLMTGNIFAFPGSGAAAGLRTTGSGTMGSGGRGGGAIILYCGGNLTFNGYVDISGDSGTDGSGDGSDTCQGGGGGAGGFAGLFGRRTITNTGIINSSGGTYGTKGTCGFGSNGTAGGNGLSIIGKSNY